MTTEIFKASVQYGDLKGSSAADRADFNDAEKWLTKKGHKKEGEYLVGVSVYISETYGEESPPIYAEFLLDDSLRNLDQIPGTESDPVELKRVHVDMNINEFFGLFKRFSITLSPYGELENKYYRHDG